MQYESTKFSPLQLLREFLRLESASGIILIFAALAAILLANSPLDFLYNGFLNTPVEIRIGALKLAKPLLLWINDGLMAVFFLLIGLEVKREILEGQLSKPSQVALPGIAALGGMIVPALIYVWFNRGNEITLNGWAIPAATDIAFALGIVALLGKRVPQSLKIFLLTLAILDDLAAIVIIAIFYTNELSLVALGLAGVALLVLFILNRRGVTRIAAYTIVGVALWVFVLKSGVHATLAGVALAFAIPMRSKQDREHSPVKHLEHALHPWVAFMILPLFAFANAGLSLGNLSLNAVFEPVPLGIILGLFVGKPLGIFGISWVVIKTGLAKLPDGASWRQLYGMAQMCGVGFTMSLFIATLAFDEEAANLLFSDRLGILTGSLLSAVWGYIVLRFSARRDGNEIPLPAANGHH